MPKFPVDASKKRVVKTFELLGFEIVREREHIVMQRENQDGTVHLWLYRITPILKAGHLEPFAHRSVFQERSF
jgi:hypothetical protein